MNKKIIQRSLLIVSTLLFIAGIICTSIYYISTQYFNNAHTRNYLPPAGDFIEGSNEFTFAVMGDSGLRNEPLGLIFKDITKHDYPFILDVGDQARKLMSSNFELLLQVINKNIGNYPFYSVPGNHDVVYKGKGSGKPENYLRFYNRAFGQAYYWFSYGKTLFIGLDTSKGGLYPKQENWLITTLNRLRSSFSSCVIFMHIPPIDPRPGQNYCMGKAGAAELLNILEKYNITAIIAGHIHKGLTAKFGNIPLYIAPPSGQKFRSGQKYYGYLKCTITPDNKLTVNEINVTQKDGRDHFTSFISTEAQRSNVFQIGIICLILSWGLLVFSSYYNKILIRDHHKNNSIRKL